MKHKITLKQLSKLVNESYLTVRRQNAYGGWDTVKQYGGNGPEFDREAQWQKQENIRQTQMKLRAELDKLVKAGKEKEARDLIFSPKFSIVIAGALRDDPRMRSVSSRKPWKAMSDEEKNRKREAYFNVMVRKDLEDAKHHHEPPEGFRNMQGVTYNEQGFDKIVFLFVEDDRNTEDIDWERSDAQKNCDPTGKFNVVVKVHIGTNQAGTSPTYGTSEKDLEEMGKKYSSRIDRLIDRINSAWEKSDVELNGRSVKMMNMTGHPFGYVAKGRSWGDDGDDEELYVKGVAKVVYADSVKESTKVTLTVGQLKRLVKESSWDKFVDQVTVDSMLSPELKKTVETLVYYMVDVSNHRDGFETNYSKVNGGDFRGLYDLTQALKKAKITIDEDDVLVDGKKVAEIERSWASRKVNLCYKQLKPHIKWLGIDTDLKPMTFEANCPNCWENLDDEPVQKDRKGSKYKICPNCDTRVDYED